MSIAQETSGQTQKNGCLGRGGRKVHPIGLEPVTFANRCKAACFGSLLKSRRTLTKSTRVFAAANFGDVARPSVSKMSNDVHCEASPVKRASKHSLEINITVSSASDFCNVYARGEGETNRVLFARCRCRCGLRRTAKSQCAFIVGTLAASYLCR